MPRRLSRTIVAALSLTAACADNTSGEDGSSCETSGGIYAYRYDSPTLPAAGFVVEHGTISGNTSPTAAGVLARCGFASPFLDLRFSTVSANGFQRIDGGELVTGTVIDIGRSKFKSSGTYRNSRA